MYAGEGKPKITDEKQTTVYKRALDVEYRLKMAASRQVRIWPILQTLYKPKPVDSLLHTSVAQPLTSKHSSACCMDCRNVVLPTAAFDVLPTAAFDVDMHFRLTSEYHSSF